jgi:predicted sugar kinase
MSSINKKSIEKFMKEVNKINAIFEKKNENFSYKKELIKLMKDLKQKKKNEQYKI